MLKRRIVLAAPGVALLAVLVPTLLLADRLPDPLASHWNFSGEADGSTGLAPLTAVVAIAVAAAWALLVRQAVARGSGPRLTVAPWVWGAVEKATAENKPNLRIAGLPFPVTPGGASNSLHLAAKTDPAKKAAAWNFIQMAASPEWQHKWESPIARSPLCKKCSRYLH